MGGRVHRVAAAGNTAVLIALVAAAASSEVLFEDGPPAVPPIASVRDGSPAARALLVVIDGLRADTASDPDVMPFLCELAREGGSGVARVECLVPSSVAAIETLATGRVPPPVSFLSDFGAAPAERGGVFAAVGAAGGTSFVAGPALWTDRFGRWIDAAEPDPTFGVNDEQLLGASLDAIRSRRDRLVVVHFGRVDACAHRFGTASAEYQAAAGWCDRATRAIAAAAGSRTAIFVTSDHGNRDGGGHAGREPDVILTPLVIDGPRVPVGTLGEIPQRAIPDLLLRALALDGAEPGGVTDRAGRPFRPPPLLVVAIAVACGTAIWSGVSGTGDGRCPAFVLNAAVWIVIVLLTTGRPIAATWLGLAALVAGAAINRMRVDLSAALLVFAGAAVGLGRLVDGYLTLASVAPEQLALPAGLAACGCVPSLLLLWSHAAWSPGGYFGRNRGEWLMLAASGFAFYMCVTGVKSSLVFVGGVITGLVAGSLLVSEQRAAGAKQRATGVPHGPAWTGAMLTVAYALLHRAAGETVSLSTVDVRPAFGVVNLPFGAPIAAAIVAASQAAPAVGLLLGGAPTLTRLAPHSFGAFAAGLAASVAGQTAVAVVALWSSGGTGASLGLGLLLRALAESMYFFLGTAVVALVARQLTFLDRVARRAGGPETT